MRKSVTLEELSPLLIERLQQGGDVIFTVTGNSMWPLLRHRRDQVSIVRPQPLRLRKYDIPLFVRPNGRYILHRVVGMNKDGYVVVGDGQSTLERGLTPEQVLGIVQGFWRNGSYIPCTAATYRLYCHLWVWAYPLRWVCQQASRVWRTGLRFCWYVASMRNSRRG